MNEQYSDETAAAHLTSEERIHYCEMLIQAAGNYTETPDMGLGFSGGKRVIKRRIQRIMATKKKNVMFAAVAGLIGCVLSTGVALAYEAPRIEEGQGEEYTVDFDIDEYILLDSDANLSAIEEMPYDDFLTDENGQIHEVTVHSQQQRAVCFSHQFLKATRKTHKKDGNGGCTTKYYHAQVCEKCGYIVVGDLYRTVTDTVCTHSS